VQFSRALRTNVAEEAWRAAATGLMRVMCWRSSVMRSARSTGLALGVSSWPGILRGSPYTSSGYRCLRDLSERCADSEENQRKRLCPLLVRVSHDGCIQCPVEAFHEPASRWVAGCRPRELNATHLGQGLEKLRFKLTSLFCGDGFGQPKRDIQPVSRVRATVSDVMSGIWIISG
jgi:hypothetical protein